MRTLTLTASVLCLAAAGCVVTDGADSSLFVANDSDFEIHEMYVTGIDSSSWGPNLIAGQILLPGDSVELALECGTYDTMLVDETGAICEVHDVDLCFADADWIIRNSSCAVFEERAAAMAAGGK